ncbi:MAG: HNH endonuclease [Terriglobales bacterium]
MKDWERKLFKVYTEDEVRRDGYPYNWSTISWEVRQRAGKKCVRCGRSNDPKAGYTLTVHHLDGAKLNCTLSNLAALCQRCHLRVQGHRWLHPLDPQWQLRLFPR